MNGLRHGMLGAGPRIWVSSFIGVDDALGDQSGNECQFASERLENGAYNIWRNGKNDVVEGLLCEARTMARLGIFPKKLDPRVVRLYCNHATGQPNVKRLCELGLNLMDPVADNVVPLPVRSSLVIDQINGWKL